MGVTPCSSQPFGIALPHTYRGDIRVGRGHFHQVNEVGLVLPGGIVVIDVQQRDVHLGEGKEEKLLQEVQVPEAWNIPWMYPQCDSGSGRATIPQGI